MYLVPHGKCLLYDMTWHDMTWHDMTWHDLTWHYIILYIYIYIYIAAIGLTPGGSSTAHIYTQTVYRAQRSEQT
jgi:hypothetical protein